jgi:DNA-directed RNA polymerase specialized sigma subunit
MNVENLIQKVTNETIIKLKKSGLINESDKKSFKKTEEVLRNYKEYQNAIAADKEGTAKTQKLVNIIEAALRSIEDDIYYEIINMFYFKGDTREEIAEYFNCDVKTITRNKRRLINKMKLIIFSDQTIMELFEL